MVVTMVDLWALMMVEEKAVWMVYRMVAVKADEKVGYSENS